MEQAAEGYVMLEDAFQTMHMRDTEWAGPTARHEIRPTRTSLDEACMQRRVQQTGNQTGGCMCQRGTVCELAARLLD